MGLNNSGQKEGSVNSNPVRSYKIGRNEACPCGSGKKYKKCCANINPAHPKEYYLQKLKNKKQEEQYPVLKEAIKDYPLDPDFIIPLIVYYYMEDDKDKALAYLQRAWRIMHTDLGEDFQVVYLHLLLEKEELAEAQQVSEKIMEEGPGSPRLFVMVGEVYKALGDQDQVNYLIKRGLKLYPDHQDLLDFKLETLLDEGNVIDACYLWQEKFDIFKKIDKSPSVEYLKHILKINYDLKENASRKEIKEKLDSFLKASIIGDEIDSLIAEGSIEEAEEKMEQLVEMVPKKSPMVIGIINNYLSLGKFKELIELGQVVKKYHLDNPSFVYSLAEGNLHLENYQEAINYLNKAVGLALEKEPVDWRIVGDSLHLILHSYDETELKEFSLKVSKELEDDKTLLNTLIFALRKANKWGEDYYLFLNKIKEILADLGITLKEYYITDLYYSLQELEQARLLDETLLKGIRERIVEKLSRVRAEKISSPLFDYLELQLGYEEDKSSLLERMKKESLDYREEEIVLWEAVLKYGDKNDILNGKLETKLIGDNDKNLYRLIAALLAGDKKTFKKLFYLVFLNHILDDSPAFILKILSFVSQKDLMDMIREIGVEKGIVDSLNQILASIDLNEANL